MGVGQDALQFANRAQDLMNNFGALDHQTVATLASQSGSDEQAQQSAQTVAQAIAQTWDGYEQTWSDPVLQTQPSVATGVTQFIHDTIGPPPIDAGTISQLQAALQKDGLGSGLATDGAWTPDWQQQYNQALEAARADQYAGNKPGSVKTSSALHGFLSHLTVTGALDAIGGWVKSIPDDARTVAGYVGGHLAGLGHEVTHPSEILRISEAEKQTIATVNRSIQNALGGHKTQQQTLSQEGIAGGLNALNAALTFAGVAGIGKKALEDISANIARGTLAKGSAELARKPGVIAKTLFNGNQNGRLLGSKWVGNLPGLSRVTPMVGKLAGSDGWWYTARTMLAQPYRYAGARAAGQAFSRTQLAGLGLYADALATSKLPGNTQAQNVLDNHVFDAIDHNITNYGPRVFGWSPLDVNNLALFLHGPAGLGAKGSASHATGEATQAFLDNFTDMLGEKGVPAAFQQATGMSHKDWLSAADGDGHFLSTFMTSKVVGYAKDWWADRQLGEGLHGSAKEQVQKLTAAKQQFNQLSKEDKAQAVSDMLASDPSGTWLTTRIKGDIARGAADPKAGARKSLATFRDQTERMQTLDRIGGLKYLMTPKGAALLQDEANSYGFGGDIESGLPYQTRGPSGLTREGVAPPLSRRDFMNTANGHARTIRTEINAALKVSAKRMSDAQAKLKAASGPKERHGAQTSLRFAQQKHEQALMSVGRTPQDVIDRAQTEADQAAQSLRDAEAAGDGAQIAAARVNLQATQKKLQRVKTSTRNMNLRDLLDNTVGVDKTAGQRKKLESLERRRAALAEMLKPALLPEELGQEIRNSINGNSRFDELYTRLAGPNQALPPDFGSGAHMARLLPNLEQDLGLARVDTLTRGDVLNAGGIADQFDAALAAAGKDPAARLQVAQAAAKHLNENHNWDERKLGLFGDTDNPKALLDAVRSEAQDLAADVFPTYDMPQTVAKMIDAMRAAGYKIVVGDHLGDFYTGNLPDIGAGNGWLTGLRKWAGKTGIDPTRVPDKDVGRATRQGVVDELTPIMVKYRDQGLLGGPYKTPQTLLSMLTEDGGVQRTLPRYLAGVFHSLARVGANKTEVEQIFKEGKVDSIEAARAELERKMASGIGLRDTSRKAIVKAILTTHTVKTANGGEWTWHGLPAGDLTDEQLASASAEVKAARRKSEQVANEMFRGIQRGYRQPGYIMGWQMIENWARAGYGIGDKIATRFPGSTLAQNVANWPNRVAQVRNRLRFTASFVYDFRRWAKQSAKMAAEGVEPVGSPLQNLMDSGSDIEARNLLLKIGGHPPELNDQMDADRMLAGRSIFGIYNPLWHAAYFVHQLREQGKDEDYIKEAYNRTFKYGKSGGTSPLERSFNTVFFPFSFEKTLIRNFGAYLLDRPAQALALDLAVDEWRKVDKNAAIGKWIDDHLPILQEMQLLNAFAHGISPGELGGINAPIIGGAVGVVKHAAGAVSAPPTAGQKSLALLNLFMPQDWGANLSPKNLSRYLPVWNQFANTWSDAIEQSQIGINALYDTVNHTTNAIQIRPTLTERAQQQYGTREKVTMQDKLATVLDFNGKQPDDASKILWLASPQVPQAIWGQPISRTTIGEFVHGMYPAYNPDESSAYAVQQERAEAQFISQVAAQDPAKGRQMATFGRLANSVVGKINRDEYTQADMARVQGAFHDFARAQGKTDPDWLHLWEAFYGYALGPVRSPDGKAA